MADEPNDRARDMMVPLNRRTYGLGIVNGVFGYTASRVADPNTIVPLLLHRLSGAASVVGLVLGLKGVVEALAQVGVARSLDARDRKKPGYILGSLTQSLTYVIITAVLWYADLIPAGAVLAVFIVALLGYRAGLAISGLALNDILTKSVPTTRRGSLHMWRKLAALVVVFFGVTRFVEWAIGPEGPFDFPRSFALLFATSVVANACGWLLFAQVKEPASRSADHKATWSEHLRRGIMLFRGDSCYRRVIRIRLLVGIAAGIRPFLVVFATSVWELPDEIAATFIATQICAEFVGAVVAGRVSDRLGNRRAILFMIWSIALCCGAAVVAASATWDVTVDVLYWQANLQMVILGAAFVGSGLFLASLQIGYNNYLMDIAPENLRPSYIGFSRAFTVPLAIAPVAYGWSADVFGYLPVFITGLVLCMAAIYLFGQLPEPRDEVDDEQLRRAMEAPVPDDDGEDA